MEIVLFGLGLLILVITYLDFFHTTLSGQGFGWMTGRINKGLGQLVMRNRKSWVYTYSGILHLLTTALFWLLMLLFGAFIIFASSPEMVIHSQTKITPGLLERFYFSGAVLSTLGIGDYIPGNDLSRTIVTFLSFSGFILLTTALTYLISVVNTVLQKKQLAIFISTIGNDIDEIYQSIITPEGENLLITNTETIREKIIKNSSNYIFFPIVQFYLSKNKNDSLELQLTRLYEVLCILNFQYERNSSQSLKIKRILAAIVNYVNLGVQKQDEFLFDDAYIREKRKFWSRHHLSFPSQPKADKAINASLMSAGWNWDDVYELNERLSSEFI